MKKKIEYWIFTNQIFLQFLITLITFLILIILSFA